MTTRHLSLDLSTAASPDTLLWAGAAMQRLAEVRSGIYPRLARVVSHVPEEEDWTTDTDFVFELVPGLFMETQFSSDEISDPDNSDYAYAREACELVMTAHTELPAFRSVFDDMAAAATAIIIAAQADGLPVHLLEVRVSEFGMGEYAGGTAFPDIVRNA